MYLHNVAPVSALNGTKRRVVASERCRVSLWGHSDYWPVPSIRPRNRVLACRRPGLPIALGWYPRRPQIVFELSFPRPELQLVLPFVVLPRINY